MIAICSREDLLPIFNQQKQCNNRLKANRRKKEFALLSLRFSTHTHKHACNVPYICIWRIKYIKQHYRGTVLFFNIIKFDRAREEKSARNLTLLTKQILTNQFYVMAGLNKRSNIAAGKIAHDFKQFIYIIIYSFIIWTIFEHTFN